MQQHAGQIEAMVSSRAMPPGNATGLTDTERDAARRLGGGAR